MFGITLFINWNVKHCNYIWMLKRLSKSVAYTTKLRLFCDFNVICKSPFLNSGRTCASFPQSWKCKMNCYIVYYELFNILFDFFYVVYFLLN